MAILDAAKAATAHPAPHTQSGLPLFLVSVRRVTPTGRVTRLVIVPAVDEPSACWAAEAGVPDVVGSTARRFVAPRNAFEAAALAEFNAAQDSVQGLLAGIAERV